MKAVPKPADIARLLTLAEDGLRRSGFGERAIQRSRKANRAAIEARLSQEAPHE